MNPLLNESQDVLKRGHGGGCPGCALQGNGPESGPIDHRSRSMPGLIGIDV